MARFEMNDKITADYLVFCKVHESFEGRQLVLRSRPRFQRKAKKLWLAAEHFNTRTWAFLLGHYGMPDAAVAQLWSDIAQYT
jgi:hypothetical protein